MIVGALGVLAGVVCIILAAVSASNVGFGAYEAVAAVGGGTLIALGLACVWVDLTP